MRKKDGTSRFCVDYRKVNSVTRKDAYPLPRINDVLDTLAGSKLFSTLDLISGYWQVGLHQDDKEKTAFCTSEGLCISYNMGTSALPDMYARSPRAAGPRAEGIHIRQSTSAHVITNMLHFWHS